MIRKGKDYYKSRLKFFSEGLSKIRIEATEDQDHDKLFSNNILVFFRLRGSASFIIDL